MITKAQWKFMPLFLNSIEFEEDSHKKGKIVSKIHVRETFKKVFKCDLLNCKHYKWKKLNDEQQNMWILLFVLF